MHSASSATEVALYEALAAGLAGASVYQDAPTDAPLPLVIVGDLSEAPLGKGEPDAIVTASIFFEVAAEERAPLLDLQRQARDLLHEQDFTVEDWTVSPSITATTAELAEDGKSYVGVASFTCFALRA